MNIVQLIFDASKLAGRYDIYFFCWLHVANQTHRIPYSITGHDRMAIKLPWLLYLCILVHDDCSIRVFWLFKKVEQKDPEHLIRKRIMCMRWPVYNVMTVIMCVQFAVLIPVTLLFPNTSTYHTYLCYKHLWSVLQLICITGSNCYVLHTVIYTIIYYHRYWWSVEHTYFCNVLRTEKLIKGT